MRQVTRDTRTYHASSLVSRFSCPGPLVAVAFPGPGRADGLPLAAAAHPFEHQLIHLELHRHRVVTGEAGGAKRVPRLLDGAHQPLDGQVIEGVGADVPPDLLHALAGADELP